MVNTLFEGYNCCVFAYGATGAGKTHTMLGSKVAFNLETDKQDRTRQDRNTMINIFFLRFKASFPDVMKTNKTKN